MLGMTIEGTLLACTLFPDPPTTSSVSTDFTYPDPVESWTDITKELSRPVPLAAVVLKVSFLIATVGSTCTSPTVVLVGACVFW